MTLYSKEHLWVDMVEDDLDRLNLVMIGISDYASKEMNGIVYADLGNPQRVVKRGEELGSIESTKTVSSLVCPFDCGVHSVNKSVEDNVGKLNEHPEDKSSSWLYVVIPEQGWQDGLMTRDEYEKYIMETSGHEA